MVNKKKHSKENGFTIIELMIATSVFSVVILVVTAGIIRIGQLYYKGVTQARVQNSVRVISDDLSRAVQFSDVENTVIISDNPEPDGLKKFCLGNLRYSGNIDKPYRTATGATPNTPVGNPTGLWVEEMRSGVDCATCNNPATCTVTGKTKQLLGENMRLLKFEVSKLGGGTDKAWTVNVKLAYGASELLTHYTDQGVRLSSADRDERISWLHEASCRPENAGGSFCAVAQLDTVVKKRLY